MGLSGETIRNIREALKSAFPNRDELVMMLRTELDIPESEVPSVLAISSNVWSIHQISLGASQMFKLPTD
ncbi:MAG: hypothetical protein HC862_25680 [Scytonema sp. RU_4_4]|nr:hypothetical protein [Scytonema sp. RU_4_4]